LYAETAWLTHGVARGVKTFQDGVAVFINILFCNLLTTFGQVKKEALTSA